MAKKIAIIGGGCSGLTAIKCCLDEKLEPVCFERTDQIGGLWRYTEKVADDQGCVMKSTIINTSKEMMCYSDFPIPKEYPNFMHNTQVWDYFRQYAAEFGLKKYVQYNKEVLSAKPASDFEKTGRWEIEVRDHETNDVQSEIFDGVVVCTGHHAMKNTPTFRGQEDFQGEIVHSHDYRHWGGYEGKRVVIIGIGNSGGDAAVELSRVCKVFLSTRRGSWVLNRVSDGGIPLDMNGTSRFTRFMQQILPESLINTVLERQVNKRFNHKLYGLQPKHRIFGQHPMVNDDLPNRIASGSLVIKDDVKKFTKTGVEFVDGTFEEDIDTIMLATGYIFGFPFIDKSVIDVKKNKVHLFKYMFPPDLAKPTLAVIGYIQPLGAIMPICELQCRLATRVFKGDVTLPSKEDMWKDVREKEAAMAARYCETQRHTIQVDYVDFMDQLAELNGCKPDIGGMLLTDPKLALTCFFGPTTPYQYRLNGPGKWPKAREAIMTQWDRMRYPLETRRVPVMDQGLLSRLWLLIFVGILLAIFISVYM